MEPTENILARLTLKNRESYIQPAVQLVRTLSGMEGLTDKQLLQLETATEEACLNVIQHAFEPGEEGSFDLIVVRQPGKLVVALEDKGIPFDPASIESGQQGGLGLKLMRGLADEVKFVSLGKKGKRVELVKFLPREDPANLMTDTDRNNISKKDILSDEPVTFRKMAPDDAIGLTRCVYRTYGYTYGSDYIYNPSEVKEMLISGILESFLAVTQSDEIVGHLALIYHKPGAMVGESGQAVVDNRFRGRKLFEKLKTGLLGYAQQKGLFGVYSEATTAHPYSQKGNITLGAVETGFLLGYAPESVLIKNIDNSSSSFRLSALLYYLKVNEEPLRKIYLPSTHKEMLSFIIGRIKLNREICEPGRLPELPGNTVIRSKIRPEWGHAIVTVDEYGHDFLPVAKSLLKEIRNQKIDSIYVDLPLSAEHTPHFYAELELLGFSYSCLIPEFEEGDVIRMQYLNNFTVDPGKISVASEFGKELLDYIIKDLRN